MTHPTPLPAWCEYRVWLGRCSACDRDWLGKSAKCSGQHECSRTSTRSYQKPYDQCRGYETSTEPKYWYLERTILDTTAMHQGVVEVWFARPQTSLHGIAPCSVVLVGRWSVHTKPESRCVSGINIDGMVQDCGNSSTELPQSCTKPSI